jgi:hypothetical protein
LGDDLTAALKRAKVATATIWCSLNNPPQALTMLMDPRGVAHCTTGVLPTQSLRLDPEHFAKALDRLQVDFLCAPLLTTPGRTEVAVPQLPGWEISWLQRDGLEWTTHQRGDAPTGQLSEQSRAARFGATAEIREGYLRMRPTHDASPSHPPKGENDD